EDAAFVAGATAGADTLFLLVPPNYTPDDWEAWQLAVGRNAADAVRANGIRRVVLLSSAGAHRADLSAISRLGDIERLLQAAAPDVAALRAGFFMENLLQSVPTIRDQGSIFQALAPDAPVPFVATRDLGDEAARWLADASWSGHVTRLVLGPDEVTPTSAAGIVADAVGRPVAFVQIPPEAVREALLGMGASESVATGYAQMMRGLSDSRFELEPRDSIIRGRTTLAEWARTALAPALAPALTA
ncbi:MAG TPA: NmrA family NAD(P)-binding protein, partial [Longimicrobium sp.]|nr:NmrA family NAD(P)-binding protein [Longimicrobium sp.]